MIKYETDFCQKDKFLNPYFASLNLLIMSLSSVCRSMPRGSTWSRIFPQRILQDKEVKGRVETQI